MAITPPWSCALERGHKAGTPRGEVRAGRRTGSAYCVAENARRHTHGTGEEAAEERGTGGAAGSRKHGCVEGGPSDQAVTPTPQGTGCRGMVGNWKNMSQIQGEAVLSHWDFIID